MNSDWTISRRSFLAASVFIPGIVPRALAQDSRGTTPTAGVQTTAGKVRGLVRYGVNQFYGVPYAASTAGANRFMPPAKPAAGPAFAIVFRLGKGRRKTKTVRYRKYFL